MKAQTVPKSLTVQYYNIIYYSDNDKHQIMHSEYYCTYLNVIICCNSFQSL